MEPVFDIKPVSPAAGAKFSPNLHAWLRKNFGKRCYPQHRPEVFRDSEGSLYVGFVNGTDLIGSRLGLILSRGGRAQTFCILGAGTKYKKVANFWRGYLKLGRCFLDPKHRMNFQDERWDEGPRRRTCTWCGLRQKVVLKKKTVVDRVWVAA